MACRRTSSLVSIGHFLFLLLLVGTSYAIRLSCEVWRLEGSPNGDYMVDPDGYGPSSTINVTCDMNQTPAKAVFNHDRSTNKLYASNTCSAPGCMTIPLTYTAGTASDISAYIDMNSQSCEQFVSRECMNSFSNDGSGVPYHWWNDRSNTKQLYWGDYAPGTYSKMMCTCATTSSCAAGTCNCDIDDGTWRKDEGTLTDMTHLPLSSVQFGDVNTNEQVFSLVGALSCEDKAGDFCGYPGDVVNGVADTTFGVHVGQSITYSCNFGYEVNTANSGIKTYTRVCTSSNTWSSSQPVCIPVDCGAPGTGNNAIVSTPATANTFGSTISFACNTGYELPGAVTTQTSVCSFNGLWTPGAPQCQAISCGHPTPGIKTSVTGTDYTYPNTVSYVCDPGYEIGAGSGTSSLVITCQTNKQWTSPAPICTIKDCGDPGSGVQTSKAGTIFTYGSKVTYTCSNGYEIVGVGSTVALECLATGSWDLSAPTCTIVNCGNPGQGTNAGLVGSVFVYQSIITYVCNVGYETVGGLQSANIKCLATGKWDKSPVTCKALSCSSPGHGTHSKLRSKTFTYLKPVEYKCDWGYETAAKGKFSYIYCTAAKTWNTTAPTCYRQNCGFAPQIKRSTYGTSTHKFPLNTTYLYEDYVEMVCDSGYRIPETESDKQVKLVCNGEVWKPTYTSCEIQPPDEPLLSQSQIIGLVCGIIGLLLLILLIVLAVKFCKKAKVDDDDDSDEDDITTIKKESRRFETPKPRSETTLSDGTTARPFRYGW